MRRTSIAASLMLLSACFPSEIVIDNAGADAPSILFYPGGNVLDDLLIVNGKNFFGTAQYQIDDPLGDIGFRFETGERVQAECIVVGRDILGEPECQRYEVYRSSFPQIPEGSQANRPRQF